MNDSDQYPKLTKFEKKEKLLSKNEPGSNVDLMSWLPGSKNVQGKLNPKTEGPRRHTADEWLITCPEDLSKPRYQACTVILGVVEKK